MCVCCGGSTGGAKYNPSNSESEEDSKLFWATKGSGGNCEECQKDLKKELKKVKNELGDAK